MMVKSREHRLLSCLSLSVGRRPRRWWCSASSVVRVGCSCWVSPYSSVPFGFSFLLLLLVGERGPCFLRQGARPSYPSYPSYPSCDDTYYSLLIRGRGLYMGTSVISLGRYWVYRTGSEVLYKRAQSVANGDQAHLDGHDGRLGAVRSPQLTEYSPHVVLDRASTKEQLPGDLLVGAPVGHEPQNLRLPRRKLPAVRVVRRGHLPSLGGMDLGGRTHPFFLPLVLLLAQAQQQPRGDLLVERELLFEHLVYGFHDLFRIGALQDVAACPGP